MFPLNLHGVSALPAVELSTLINFRSFSAVSARAILSVGTALAVFCGGCQRPPNSSVVIYTSVDQKFAQRILADFERQTGVHVMAVYDSEAGKTTGFLRRLVRERSRPRCDVWWSSEVFGTIELAREGLLEPLPGELQLPQHWRAANGTWAAFAARARVVAVNPNRCKVDAIPNTWRGLADAPILSRLAVANPQFGTTRGHVGAMFAYWGNEAATAYLQKLRDASVAIADGNAHAVRMLAAGRADLCWTDTDDVWSAQRRGEEIELVYPRLDEDAPVIWIPNSVALVAGGPNVANGRRLAQFLVSEQVERALFESDSRNVPVRPALREAVGYEGPEPEPLDFERVVDALPEAMRVARRILLQ
jgi:iron(III) transport system substrate-binding protein